jgi:16S rRNA G966 N2-methylase RsmD
MGGAARNLDQAAEATTMIRSLVNRARERLLSGFDSHIDALGVFVDPPFASEQLRDAFEALARAQAIMASTAWPDRCRRGSIDSDS